MGQFSHIGKSYSSTLRAYCYCKRMAYNTAGRGLRHLLSKVASRPWVQAGQQRHCGICDIFRQSTRLAGHCSRQGQRCPVQANAQM